MAPTAGRPLSNDAEAASEPAGAQASPEFGTVAAAGRPLVVEPGQVGLQAALARPEHVTGQAAQHVAHEPAAVAGRADDLPDRHALSRQRQYRLGSRRAPTVALVLQALGAGQLIGVDRGGAHRDSDGGHRLAHGIEEGGAAVLHQMPAVGDLDRRGQRPRRGLAVAAASVTCEDGDLGMGGEPCLDGAALAIRQEGDDAPPLQVADQRAVALPTAEGPIVDADHGQGLGRPLGAAAHGSQHRVPARRHHQSAGEALRRPATEREAEMMDDGLQPSCSSGVGGGEVRFEPLGE
ncbi:hypothetical protein FHU13_005683, partial [Methylobacterium sp. R2-1]|nr:hypothetical protein [Methylobacterium sp. R2-1]